VNLERFNTFKDRFEVSNLRVYFEFKTASSIGFLAGPIMTSRHRTITGSIQLHYPSVGHIKAYLFVSLPPCYGDSKFLCELRESVFTQVGIPLDETFELHYTDSTASKSDLQVDQRTNREGLSDGMGMTCQTPGASA
jgi:hypothetical protein